MASDKKKVDDAKASEQEDAKPAADAAASNVALDIVTGAPINSARNSGEYSSPLSTNEALAAASGDDEDEDDED